MEAPQPQPQPPEVVRVIINMNEIDTRRIRNKNGEYVFRRWLHQIRKRIPRSLKNVSELVIQEANKPDLIVYVKGWDRYHIGFRNSHARFEVDDVNLLGDDPIKLNFSSSYNTYYTKRVRLGFSGLRLAVKDLRAVVEEPDHNYRHCAKPFFTLVIMFGEGEKSEWIESDIAVGFNDIILSPSYQQHFPYMDPMAHQWSLSSKWALAYDKLPLPERLRIREIYTKLYLEVRENRDMSVFGSTGVFRDFCAMMLLRTRCIIEEDEIRF